MLTLIDAHLYCTYFNLNYVVWNQRFNVFAVSYIRDMIIKWFKICRHLQETSGRCGRALDSQHTRLGRICNQWRSSMGIDIRFGRFLLCRRSRLHGKYYYFLNLNCRCNMTLTRIKKFEKRKSLPMTQEDWSDDKKTRAIVGCSKFNLLEVETCQIKYAVARFIFFLHEGNGKQGRARNTSFFPTQWFIQHLFFVKWCVKGWLRKSD